MVHRFRRPRWLRLGFCGFRRLVAWLALREEAAGRASASVPVVSHIVRGLSRGFCVSLAVKCKTRFMVSSEGGLHGFLSTVSDHEEPGITPPRRSSSPRSNRANTARATSGTQVLGERFPEKRPHYRDERHQFHTDRSIRFLQLNDCPTWRYSIL